MIWKDTALRTRLLEKPSVSLYYKGMEDDNTVPFALNAIVGFSPDDFWYSMKKPPGASVIG